MGPKLMVAVSTVMMLLGSSVGLRGASYYLDSEHGEDKRDGTSPDNAWRSLERANRETFRPGDRILFHAGDTWDGIFDPKGSGSESQPIVVDRYGDGTKPRLRGRGRVDVVLRLENQSYWEINNLAITNFCESGPRDLRGAEIRARNQGWVRHIYLKGLEIHDINAISDYNDDGSTRAKSFGGLATIIEGDVKPTAWDDLRIEDCTIRDVGPVGIAMLSTWMEGHRENDPKSWFPSRGVVIRGNKIERTERNGLIVRGCVRPLIERNYFNGCARGGSGNACFSFHCDDALFQFNESCFTRYNAGDTDATGFDSDYCCRRSVFQYNYSHDNEYGFMVICNRRPTGFNDGTIVRYNISENDGGNVFRISGEVTNTKIYGNTIYVGPNMTNPKEGDPPRVVYFKDWNRGWSDRMTFSDNVFINRCRDAVYEFGKSKQTRFRHNLFFGEHPASEPRDPQKIRSDPRLVSPGKAGPGLEAAIAAYSLQPGAPQLGAGPAFKRLAKRDPIGQAD
jgi:hypothetical protein